MKKFSAFNVLLDDYKALDWSGTLFTDRDAWDLSPTTTEFVLLEGDDELEDLTDDENRTPRLAAELDVEYFLDVEIFQSIIDIQQTKNGKSSVDDYVRALNHYLDNDSYL